MCCLHLQETRENISIVRFKVLTVVITKNIVFRETSLLNTEERGERWCLPIKVRAFVARMMVIFDALDRPSDFFVWNLRWQVRACFLRLLPRQGFGWQWDLDHLGSRPVSSSVLCPQKHTQNSGILTQQSSRSYGCWILNRVCVGTCRSRVPRASISNLNWRRRIQNGSRQPDNVTHRHENVPFAMRMSACRSHCCKKYRFSEQQQFTI